MTRLEMDRLYQSGKMPDWAYYQQAGLPWYVALQEEKDQFYREYNARKAQKMEEARIDARAQELAEKYLEEQAPEIQKQMEKIIDEVIDSLNN